MRENISPDLNAKRQAALARVERLAWWLDEAFRLPVVGKRVGVDGLLGLVPGAGDLLGAGLSVLLIGEAVRLGASSHVLLRMGANIGIDFFGGLVPVAGDIFDMAWKANRRNQRLLQRWLTKATANQTESHRQR